MPHVFGDQKRYFYCAQFSSEIRQVFLTFDNVSCLSWEHLRIWVARATVKAASLRSLGREAVNPLRLQVPHLMICCQSRNYALGLRNCTKGIPNASTMLDSVGLFPKVLETAHEIASSWPRLPNHQKTDSTEMLDFKTSTFDLDSSTYYFLIHSYHDFWYRICFEVQWWH